MRLLVGVLLALALHAAPAVAADPEPLPPGSWLVPSDGTWRTASSWPLATQFEMVSFAIYVYEDELEDGPYDIEVATGPALDPDGTLADADRVDALVATVRPGSPGILEARTKVDARWLGTPGDYYWQASYPEDDELYVSAVHRLSITPRPPPDPPAVRAIEPPVAAVPLAAPLALATARRQVRDEIVRRTHRRPQRLSPRCTLTTLYTARCVPSWRDAKYNYRGTMRVTSTPAGMRSAFSGIRTRRHCRTGCRRPLRW